MKWRIRYYCGVYCIEYRINLLIGWKFVIHPIKYSFEHGVPVKFKTRHDAQESLNELINKHGGRQIQ